MLRGSYVALITPFCEGEIDKNALERLVNWHCEAGTRGLVVGGCTGESLALTPQELGELVHLTAKAAGDTLEVWAGVGALTTHEALERACCAESGGAHGLMVFAPPYIKPSEEGLKGYFCAIHDKTTRPLMLYNNPGRACVAIASETLGYLATFPRIIGLKDSTSDMTRPTTLRGLVPKDFSLLAGEDATVAAFLAQGGDGWVSVTGNLFPRECQALCQAWEQGDLSSFARLRDFLFPISQLLFRETNPGPVKHALASLGWCLPEWRAPLGAISDGLAVLIQSMIQLKDPLSAYTWKNTAHA